MNGICTLVRIRSPYRDWERVVSWPYGTVVYDLDVSPDGSQIAASFGEISGRQEVRVFKTAEALAGEMTPVARFDFGNAVPNGFVFSSDGRYLYGSSYYTGASNIFRYDLQEQKLDAVTNAETGFFRPVPLGGDSLIVFRYSGEGFVPARIEARPLQDVSAITFLGERLAEEHPIVKEWNVGSPAAVPFDAGQQPRDYRLADGLRLESLYPVLQGYRTTAALGYRINVSDPLQLNRASVTASYSPARALPAGERLHLDAEYQRYDWRARARWNGADFYVAPPLAEATAARRALTETALHFHEPRRHGGTEEVIRAGFMTLVGRGYTPRLAGR